MCQVKWLRSYLRQFDEQVVVPNSGGPLRCLELRANLILIPARKRIRILVQAPQPMDEQFAAAAAVVVCTDVA